MSHVNYSNISALDGTILSEAFQHQFREQSVIMPALSPEDQMIRNTGGLGRSVSFTVFSGLDVNSSANTPGADLSYTDPSGTAKTVSSAFYSESIRVDGLTAAATPGDLAQSFSADLVGWCAEQADYLGLTAAVGGTKIVQGQSAVASLTASDTITTATLWKAVTELENAKAPKFMGPMGPGYMGFIPSRVKYDLFAESSGDFKTGLQNVNSPDWAGFSMGFNMGVYWFNSNSSALVGSDDGYGAVDAYYIPILGARALGMAYAPIEDAGVQDFDVFGNRSMVVRPVRPLTNGAYYADVHALAQIGFGLVNTDAVRVVACASSLGSNT